MIKYLEAHQENAKFLVATTSSMDSSGIVLATNKPVMSLGGFSGGDPILTTSQLEALIHQGTIRYFLLSSFGGGLQFPSVASENGSGQHQGQQNQNQQGNGRGPGGPSGQQSALTSWVTQHCTAVPANQWQTSSTTTSNGFGPSSQLYDCATTH